MNSQIYSRSYLQKMTEHRKQQHIDNMIRHFIHNLENVAAEGKTSYTYIINNQLQLPTITNEDLVSAFKEKFPDCNILYKEDCVDLNSNDINHKKGIVIDWS